MSKYHSTAEHLLAMKIFKAKGGSGNVELCTRFVAPHPKVVVGGMELPTECRLQQEANMLRPIVRRVQLDDKRRIAHPWSRYLPTTLLGGLGVLLLARSQLHVSSRS